MILGRLGVFSTRFAWARPDPYRLRGFSLGHDSARNYARHLCRYVASVRFLRISGTSGKQMCNGVALRGTCRSPGVTPRARSLGRYTLPPRRRVDEQHLPRCGAIDAALSL